MTRSDSVMPLPSGTTSMSTSDLRRMPLSCFLPKTSGLPCSSCKTCSLRASRSVSENHAPSLKMLQFCRISTNAEPLCAAACFSVSFRCDWKTSTERATKVASAPMGCDRGCAAMNRMEAERIHVVREAAGAADAGNHHKILALDAELGEHRLHRGENGVVAAAWAPADLLVGLKVFFCQRRWQRGGRHFLWLQTQLRDSSDRVRINS